MTAQVPKLRVAILILFLNLKGQFSSFSVSHTLIVVNNAAMNVEGLIALQDSDFISFEYKPGSGVARSYSQFNLVPQSCLTLCDPMACSTPGFPVQHQLTELPQTHVTGHGTTGCSKSGKQQIKAAYCHPAYLTYQQSTSCEMPD